MHVSEVLFFTNRKLFWIDVIKDELTSLHFYFHKVIGTALLLLSWQVLFVTYATAMLNSHS